MTKDKPYLNHSDVELIENVNWGNFSGEDSIASSTWTAEVTYAKLRPTKERVSISRTAKSAGEALLLLTEALKEQGWELR